MKFLVDAQLPHRLKTWLLTKGFDAIHTDDLPARSLAAEREIAQVANATGRVVLTKDSDFLKLHILRQTPTRLLLITTGNTVNQQLLALFEQNFDTILQLFETYQVVELSNTFVTSHSFQ